MRSQFGHLCSENIFAHDAEMEALESKRETMRARKRSCTADFSRIELKTSSPASQTSEAKYDLHAIRPDSNITPLSKLKTEAMPCMKRRRINEGSVEVIQKRNSATIATTTTSTFSCENRLNDIHPSYGDESTAPSEKLVLMDHSMSDLHPLHLEKLELRAFSSTVHSAEKPRKHKPSIRFSSKIRGSRKSQLTKIGSKRDSKPCRTAGERNIPQGTQAQPINLSDTSDQEFDSEVTTDGESDRPVVRVNNLDGPVESEQYQDTQDTQNTQNTLSDSAFESQGQLKASEDDAQRESRLRGRKEAYRAAKDLAGLGWANNYVIVSSNAGRVEEEAEL